MNLAHALQVRMWLECQTDATVLYHPNTAHAGFLVDGPWQQIILVQVMQALKEVQHNASPEPQQQPLVLKVKQLPGAQTANGTTQNSRESEHLNHTKQTHQGVSESGSDDDDLEHHMHHADSASSYQDMQRGQFKLSVATHSEGTEWSSLPSTNACSSCEVGNTPTTVSSFEGLHVVKGSDDSCAASVEADAAAIIRPKQFASRASTAPPGTLTDAKLWQDMSSSKEKHMGLLPTSADWAFLADHDQQNMLVGNAEFGQDGSLPDGLISTSAKHGAHPEDSVWGMYTAAAGQKRPWSEGVYGGYGTPRSYTSSLNLGSGAATDCDGSSVHMRVKAVCDVGQLKVEASIPDQHGTAISVDGAIAVAHGWAQFCQSSKSANRRLNVLLHHRR